MSETKKLLSELHYALDKYVVANGGKIVSVGKISIETISETVFVISIPVSGISPTQRVPDAGDSGENN